MSSYERDPATGNLSLIDGMRSLDEVKALMLDLCYPIGSMYISTVDTSPQTFLGGTWIQHTGYFLRGATSGVVANQLQEDGGEDTHTLTIAEMPSHKHNFRSNGYGWESPNIPGASATVGGNNIVLSPYNAYSGSDNSVTMLNTGGGQPHNNLPKYKNVYIWERTA